ncbi:MAG TPA: YbaK/EbsC family protein [Candidatus Brocadiia bacterium]|mgnify:CR=1 FL=1|nr:YbaK/EbsC family protein [Candidatus Brocadiia bacterium]
MPVRKLKEFLDKNGVKFVSIIHSPAFTAQEIAALAHVPGKLLAKTVMVKLDGKMAMAVVPGHCGVNLEALRELARATSAAIASEGEFEALFPDCEVGAMPPFGNLYDMAVYVDTALTEDDLIVFNAGSHKELMRVSYEDFARLVKPKVGRFSCAR